MDDWACACMLGGTGHGWRNAEPWEQKLECGMKDSIGRRAFCCFLVAVNPFEERGGLETWCSGHRASLARRWDGDHPIPADPGQSAALLLCELLPSNCQVWT